MWATLTWALGTPGGGGMPLKHSSNATEHRTGTKGVLGAQQGEPTEG